MKRSPLAAASRSATAAYVNIVNNCVIKTKYLKTINTVNKTCTGKCKNGYKFGYV